MSRFFWLLAVIAALVGSLFLIGAFLEDSAPKQEASAGIALAFAAIPYCLARAATELSVSQGHVLAELRRLNEHQQVPSGTTCKRPSCAERVRSEAQICRSCGRELPNEVDQEYQSVIEAAEPIIDDQQLDRRFKERQKEKS